MAGPLKIAFLRLPVLKCFIPQKDASLRPFASFFDPIFYFFLSFLMSTVDIDYIVKTVMKF